MYILLLNTDNFILKECSSNINKDNKKNLINKLYLRKKVQIKKINTVRINTKNQYIL